MSPPRNVAADADGLDQAADAACRALQSASERATCLSARESRAAATHVIMRSSATTDPGGSSTLNELVGVSCTIPDSCVAVGDYYYRSDASHTLAEIGSIAR